MRSHLAPLPHRATIATLALLVLAGFARAGETKADKLTFEEHIRPIFRAHCFDCHGATEEVEGSLDLRLVRFLIKGGDSGPAITPGKPDESYLLDRVRSGEMPPGEGKVSPEEIAILERWVASGAQTARPEPESIGPGLGITPEERRFWSFQPITRPAIPDLSQSIHAGRIRTPIDALLAQAMPEGLTFSPDADRQSLIKRAYFDLLGLPPTPEQTKQWSNDSGPDWYDRMLTELLNSPHYGERWARHWLDVAGYADSEGYTVDDPVRSWAWRYRDWGIRSLNDDKPIDRFLIEQLAGDELAGPIQGDLTPEQIDLLTATGYLRMAADGTGRTNTPEARNQVMVDTLKIIGTSLLGLSIQCAQCHDHRYDPIPHTDYYGLRAVFEPALDWQAWRVPAARQVSLYTAADRQQAAEIEAEAQKIAAERAAKQAEYMKQALEKELEKFEEPLRAKLREAYETPADKRTDEHKQLLAAHPSVNISPGVLYQYLPDAAEDLKKFDERINAVRAKKKPEEFIRALVEPANHAPDTKLFFRGDFQQPKQSVPPGGLTVCAPEGQEPVFAADDPSLPTTGRRLAFAKWLTNGKHPLLARVLVNRVWLHHFGKGLVSTPSDFGKLGGKPSHPELLDWLADEFMQQGWSLKKLHRLMMTSTAYRQSAEGKAAEDPTNVYYTRKPLVRLEAEAIRDRMLAASGQLDATLFGPPVEVTEDPTGQVIVSGDRKRRSLYVQARRSRPVALMQAFDAPVMETNCECRPVSTVATQSLMLLNGDFILDQAAQLADRAANEAQPLDPKLLAVLPKLPDLADGGWQFGYGSFDAENNRIASFTPLPHWTGSSWQGGSNLPDSDLGWVFLNSKGGHPDVQSRSPIRRWIAPADGVLSVTGDLSHGSPNGDGVRGRLVSSSQGKIGEWVAQNGTVQTHAADVKIQAGDAIDFIVDCRENQNADSFGWTLTLTYQEMGKAAVSISSEQGFHGPTEPVDMLPRQAARAWELALNRPPTQEELVSATEFFASQLRHFAANPTAVPANRVPTRQTLTNLCQALLSSNEFLYVD